MINTTCTICNHDRARQIYRANFDLSKINENIFSARRSPDRIHYRMVRCQTCGLLYSNPIFSPEEIELLYKKSDATYLEHVKNLNETYGHYLALLDTRVDIKDKLLEIGCGPGFFLTCAKSMGYKEVWGVEPSQKSIELAPQSIQPFILPTLFRPNLFPPQTFDLICSFQTLDHVTDPNETLQEMYRILKPSGFIFIIIHDSKAPQARILGRYSPIIDIAHIYLFDKITLKKIAEKNKFTVDKVFDVINIHSFAYWLHLFPAPNCFKK